MTFVGMLVGRICLLYVAAAVMVQNIRKPHQFSPISFCLRVLLMTCFSYDHLKMKCLIFLLVFLVIACERCSRRFLGVTGCVKNVSLLKKAITKSKVMPKVKNK